MPLTVMTLNLPLCLVAKQVVQDQPGCMLVMVKLKVATRNIRPGSSGVPSRSSSTGTFRLGLPEVPASGSSKLEQEPGRKNGIFAGIFWRKKNHWPGAGF